MLQHDGDYSRTLSSKKMQCMRGSGSRGAVGNLEKEYLGGGWRLGQLAQVRDWPAALSKNGQASGVEAARRPAAARISRVVGTLSRTAACLRRWQGPEAAAAWRLADERRGAAEVGWACSWQSTEAKPAGRSGAAGAGAGHGPARWQGGRFGAAAGDQTERYRWSGSVAVRCSMQCLIKRAGGTAVGANTKSKQGCQQWPVKLRLFRNAA